MSELSVATAYRNGRTFISDRSFTSPLKIAKPFYHDNGYTEIMVMCASPGMLAGDRYDMRFDMGDNTKTIISGQSSQKLFNMGVGSAEQMTRIRMGTGAMLRYLPYPVIPFAGSRFRSQTHIDLQPSSKLLFGDIFVAGRTGMNERFAFSEFMSSTRVSIDGRIIFLDNSRLLPSEAALNGIGFFEGYSCMGLLYLYGYDTIPLPHHAGIETAISKTLEGYAIRILGNSGDDVYEFAKQLFSEISNHSLDA